MLHNVAKNLKNEYNFEPGVENRDGIEKEIEGDINEKNVPNKETR